MIFDFSQTAAQVGNVIYFPDFTFGTTPLQPNQVIETGQVQGNSSNTIYLTGTTDSDLFN